MHSASLSDYLEDEYKQRGEKPPKLLLALIDVYTPEIKGKEVYDLLADLSKSYEYYMAKNKPREEWDEYDYMMLPIWKRLQELLEK